MSNESKPNGGGFEQVARQAGGLLAVAQQREIAEVQSKLIVARMNPRNRITATDRIVQECGRVSLAEKALYTYARGGTDITGPTIRLAEVMAQCWGNFESGVRELEQRDDESAVEAYAWDLETNFADRKTFTVPHTRYTREKGNVKLSDPRDIYEMVANMGARRKRACILAVIPGDVQEQAMMACDETLRAQITITPERIQKMLDAFKAEFGVTREQIEARIQRHVEAITPGLMIGLSKIYNSLRDGMSKLSDWFAEPARGREEERGKLDLDGLKPKAEAPPAAEKAAQGAAHQQGAGDHKGQEQKAPPGPPQGQKRASSRPPAKPDHVPTENPNYSEGADPDPMFDRNLFTGREPGSDDK